MATNKRNFRQRHQFDMLTYKDIKVLTNFLSDQGKFSTPSNWFII